MLSPLTRRDLISTAIIFALTIVCTYLGLRLRATYWTATDLAVVKAQLEADRQALTLTDAALKARVDELERSIYTSPPKPTEPVRRQTYIEVWQVNRDKELRARLAALERWRYQMER